MSDYAKLIEEWEKAKNTVDLFDRDDGNSFPFGRAHYKDKERLAAQSIIDALVAALKCAACRGTGRVWSPMSASSAAGIGNFISCPSCSPTRELVRGGGK